jgi:hypothetical protein
LIQFSGDGNASAAGHSFYGAGFHSQGGRRPRPKFTPSCTGFFHRGEQRLNDRRGLKQLCVKAFVEGSVPQQICVPVCIDILVDGKVVGQTLANIYREDLAQAGLGSGCHSFVCTLQTAIDPEWQTVSIRRSSDRVALPPNAPARRVA